MDPIDAEHAEPVSLAGLIEPDARLELIEPTFAVGDPGAVQSLLAVARPVFDIAGAAPAGLASVFVASGSGFATSVLGIAPLTGSAFGPYLHPLLPFAGAVPVDDAGAGATVATTSPDPLSAIDWGSKLSSAVVDVYFAPAGAYIDGVTDFGPAVGWTAWERQQVTSALEQVAAVTNLEFRITTSPTGAEFRLGTFQLDEYGVFAFMMPPGEPFAGFMGFDPDWLRSIDADSGNPLLSRGGFMYADMIEEILHGLGLAHAHDDGGSSTILEGVSEPVGSFGIGGLNQGVYTAMNYNEGWPGGPYGHAYQDDAYIYVNDFGYEATPMALDIAVLQRKYGADTAHATGDDSYRLLGANGLGTYFECIWDAGGVDTLRYDGARGVTIDLRPATLKGEVGGGGWPSYANGIRGGYTIAHGVVIENAYGGGGPDLLRGNSAANLLRGGAGHDTLDGGAGGDRMEGGTGNDRYVVAQTGDRVVELAGQGTDTVRSSIGYTLPSEVEHLTLTGSGSISGTGNGKANLLLGNAGANRLFGRAGSDTLQGGAGHDTLDGGSAGDRLEGGRGNDSYVVDNVLDRVVERAGEGTDSVVSTVDFVLPSAVEHLTLGGTRAIDGSGNGLGNRIKGNDAANLLAGGAGNDRLEGLGGTDRLEGGDGADTLDGGWGRDTLTGGAGCDRLTGGTGSDVFVFRSAAQAGIGALRDLITDLSADDRINLAAIDASSSVAGDQSFVFIGSARFSGTTRELRAVTGLIQGDTDGDGLADFEIGLAGAYVPTVDSFFL